MARRPVDCGEEPEDLGARAAWDARPDDAVPADSDPEERGRATLPLGPPPPDLVYPPPLTTRPCLVLEPPSPRSTTTIGPYPKVRYPPNPL